MPLLFFSDAHLGFNGYSSKYVDTVSDGTEAIRVALEKIYERASKSDIDCIVCGGDFFHTKHPTIENVRWAIQWIKKIDALGKPFFIIPGNHDSGMHNHALVFINSLKVINTKLIDYISINEYMYHDYKLIFVPFMSSETSKEKYKTTIDALNTIMQGLLGKNIIFSHIQDTNAQTGSEAFMFALRTDAIDLYKYSTIQNTILLLGHIHLRQIYQNAVSGFRICYAGSLTCMDAVDSNKQKGYILFNNDGTTIFENIYGPRLFKTYDVPENIPTEDYIRSIRLSENEVVFLNIIDTDNIDVDSIKKVLSDRGCLLGKISHINKDEEDTVITITKSNDPFKILHQAIFSLQDKDENYKNKIYQLGCDYLNKIAEKNT